MDSALGGAEHRRPGEPTPDVRGGSHPCEALSPTALDLSVFSNGVEDDDRQLSVDDLREGTTLFARAYRVAMGQEDSTHLVVRDVDQLRALNRADLMHRIASSDQAQADTRAMHEELRKKRAELKKTRSRLEQRRTDVQHLRARVAELERRPFERVRALVRKFRS